jgi:hypothetical protein
LFGNERCRQTKITAAARALSPKTPRELFFLAETTATTGDTSFFERRQTLARSA